jgi:hypothetical protein
VHNRRALWLKLASILLRPWGTQTSRHSRHAVLRRRVHLLRRIMSAIWPATWWWCLRAIHVAEDAADATVQQRAQPTE